MGNCQAIDNATLVVQHPCGRVDKLYWPVTAGELLKTNPGHYVALLLTTTTATAAATAGGAGAGNTVRVTRIKLLRPTDTLVLGQAYRLIPAAEVMKVLWAKKQAKIKKKLELGDEQEKVKEKTGSAADTKPRRSDVEKTHQVLKHDRDRRKTAATASSAAARSKAWQPSLQSIHEAGI
ncbi:unnamed protein product [Thlaspi arvense]|uniref:Uncharacterized protein n=1 Tax=Thlaspi arvense TaxID=13288 RepID=A0AAU9RTE7_THLAR|nr:unnamed protein product [Thlaspi arvense]